MRRLCFASSVFATFLFVVWYCSRGSTPELFQNAWQLLQHGSTTEAITQLRILQRRSPDSSEARLLRAAIDVRLGMPDLALRHLQHIPGDKYREQSLMVAGESYYRLHRYLEAEVAFRQLTELNPKSELGLRWLVAVYYDLGAYVHAMDISNRLTALRSQDFTPHRMLGMMSRDFERNQQAILHFRRALELGPPQDVRVEIVEELAAALVDEHEYDEAVALIEESLVQTSGTSHSLARSYWALGNPKLAIKHLALAEEDGPMNESVALTRARFALESGEPERAEPILRKIVAADPANIDAYYILGLVLGKRGQNDESRNAHAEHNRLVSLKETLTELNVKAIQNPRDGNVRIELADVCEKLGKHDLAQMWHRAANACLAIEAAQTRSPSDP